MRAVDVLGLNIDLANGSPLVLLREHDAPHRVLPIFVGAPEATAIGRALSDDSPPRPLTHDLLATFLHSLHAQVDRVEVTELREGTFHAELTVHGPTGERRLDSRPSDAIALALRVDAPLFASDDVLDEAGAILTVVEGDAINELTDEEIDDEVARFRALLDTLDPARLETDTPAPPPPAEAPPDDPTANGPDADPNDPPDTPYR